MNRNKIVDQILNVFWILFGAGICHRIHSSSTMESFRAGERVYPLPAGLLIGVIGLLLFLGDRSKGSEQEEKGKFWENPTARNRVFYLLASLCFMALSMKILGFLLTAVIVTIFMIRAIEPRKWMTLILVVPWLLFVHLFLV